METDLLSHFLSALAMEPAAAANYGGKTRWTKVALASLVTVGKAVSPDGSDCAAKGHRSEHGRSEHLGIDVLVYSKPLGPIHFAAEHENSPSLDILKYQLWKLANVRAGTRLLVGYWRRAGRGPRYDFVELVRQLTEVARKIPGTTTTLIAGDHDATPKSHDDFRGVFKSAVIRV